MVATHLWAKTGYGRGPDDGGDRVGDGPGSRTRATRAFARARLSSSDAETQIASALQRADPCLPSRRPSPGSGWRQGLPLHWRSLQVVPTLRGSVAVHIRTVVVGEIKMPGCTRTPGGDEVRALPGRPPMHATLSGHEAGVLVHSISGFRLRGALCFRRRPPTMTGSRTMPALQLALFGLGCFWGAEKRFWTEAGVYSTAVGYAGGATRAPRPIPPTGRSVAGSRATTRWCVSSSSPKGGRTLSS